MPTTSPARFTKFRPRECGCRCGALLLRRPTPSHGRVLTEAILQDYPALPSEMPSVSALEDEHLQARVPRKRGAGVDPGIVLDSVYCECFLENSPSVNDFD